MEKQRIVWIDVLINIMACAGCYYITAIEIHNYSETPSWKCFWGFLLIVSCCGQ